MKDLLKRGSSETRAARVPTHGNSTSVGELRLIVPMTPPSVNGYVRHTRRGSHYKTEQAHRFEWAMQTVARGEKVIGNYFAVDIDCYLAPGEHPDVDNLPKLVLDGLAKAGVFVSPKGKLLSDSYVDDCHPRKFRNERANPRTEIRVRSL